MNRTLQLQITLSMGQLRTDDPLAIQVYCDNLLQGSPKVIQSKEI